MKFSLTTDCYYKHINKALVFIKEMGHLSRRLHLIVSDTLLGLFRNN